MAKSVTKEALEQMVTLQKGYIDKGDRDNSQAIEVLETRVAQNAAQNAQEIAQNAENIEVLAQTIDVLAGYNSVVGDFPKGNSDYLARDVWGHPKNLLKVWVPVLMDTTDNTGTTTKAKRLRRNNLLRFEDGSFAPVVGITKSMYDECMTNDLYTLNEGAYTLVYAAGAYDAAVQWEADKKLIEASQELPTLYKKVAPAEAGGEETYVAISHRLRPWETTETKYTIGVANLIDLYLADNQMGASGKYIKGIFFNGSPYDGIEISKWKLPPTAIGPCPITTIREGNVVKARNFFYLYRGIDNCRSSQGKLAVNPFYGDGVNRTYPRTNDVNQMNNMKYARNNNANVNAPYPFAEGGYFAHNVFITALELAAGSRYIHAANLFGSGISTDDGTTAANFYTSGGIRFREAGDEDAAWNYRTWGDKSNPFQYSDNDSSRYSSMCVILTDHWPKEQCMESQLAASMAVELGIKPTMAEDTVTPITFEFYGNTYYYMDVPGFDGLQDGDMNVRVYKLLHANVEAFKAEEFTPSHAQTWDLEIVQRMSLFNGVNLCGDIQAYYGGGLEIVGTHKGGNTPSTGSTIRIYAEPDQTQWHTENDKTKPEGQTFDFQDKYALILETTNLGDSYTLEREGYTPWRIAEASSMAQGECYYQWDDAYWNRGSAANVRLGALFRGDLDYYRATSSPRTLSAGRFVYNISRSYSGSAQTLVEFV